MNKFVISILLICAVYVADSFSIDSTFNAVCDCGDAECQLDNKGVPAACVCGEKQKMDTSGKCRACDCGDAECQLDDKGKPKTCVCGEKQEMDSGGKCRACDCGVAECQLDDNGIPKTCVCGEKQVKDPGGKCRACDCGDAECQLDDKGKPKFCVCGEKQEMDSGGKCRACDCGEAECQLDDKGKPKTCICGERQEMDSFGKCREQMACEHLGGNDACAVKGSTWVCTNDDEADKKYKCECKSGYQPKKDNAEECEKQMGCEHLGGNDACAGKGANWVCTNDDEADEKYKCECDSGYQPKKDDAEVCEKQLGCEHLGGNDACAGKGANWVCTNDDTADKKYKCECKSGYQPKEDNVEVCEKQLGCEHLGGNANCSGKGFDWICSNDDESDKKYKCECKFGYQPKNNNSDECEKQMGCDHLGGNTICSEKGANWICINDESLQEKFKCDCEPGYQLTADACEYITTTPEDLSTRIKYFSTTPEELSTVYKSLCDEDENYCVNGGECVQLGNQRFCHCLRGTYGEKCQHMRDCDERYDLKCSYKKGEICVYNTTLEKSECSCLESGLQYDTKLEICRKTCVFGKFECENGGLCKSVGGYGFCKCLPGTSGHRCERVRDCDFMNCTNTTGGRCEYDINLEIAECVCDNGLKYDQYANECRETCEIGTHNCENGAVCKAVGDYGFCECRRGTSGHRCERVRDCDSMNCTNTTGGRCEYDRNLEIAKCVCDNGLKYDQYAYGCRETCNFRKNECQNGAICEREGNNSFCRCIPGTHGHKCEIVPDCENKKLICNEKSGAKCGINMDSLRPECVCEEGLKYDVESQACRETCISHKNKCENGAHCNHIGHYFFCDCLPGFSGHRCEKFIGKREYSPLFLFILLCITSGFLLVSTITLVTVFIKFRSRRSEK